MRGRRPASILMAIAMVIGAVGPVSGANPARDAARLTEIVARASDQYAAFAALAPSEQKAVLDYTAVASVTTQRSPVIRVSGPTSSGVNAAAVSCWTWTWGRDGRNLFGVLLWTFKQRIDWCGDGTKITNIPWRQVTATVNYPWWSYNGLVGDFTAGGQGFESYRSFVQGSFSYRPPNPLSNQDRLPWLDMTAHADGRGTGSGGG